jgi:hypothetical protein
MVESVTTTDARRDLDAVQRQRQLLADRIRPPYWYLILCGLALLALFVVPALTVRLHHHVAWSVVSTVIALATAVLSISNAVLSRTAGARIPADRVRAFPGTLRPTLAVLAIVVVGSAVTGTTAATVSWIASLTCGVASAALVLVAQQRVLGAQQRVLGAQQRVLGALRSDIRTGRTVAR